MQYTKLGTTNIEISRFCVGCMSFGDPASQMHAWTLNPKESEDIIKHALDLGINFFDTANTYSAGTSEEYLGRALKNNVARDKVVIATKVYFNEGHLSKEAINREIDSSLKRLDTDYIDLYIIHRFDHNTPLEETMEALDGLIKTGKVRALGASAMYGYQFYNMQMAAKKNEVDAVCVDAKPLQSSLPGGRAGVDSDLQADGRVADALQPARRGTAVAAGVEDGHKAKPN